VFLITTPKSCHKSALVAEPVICSAVSLPFI
jgi:hypothetical protein